MFYIVQLYAKHLDRAHSTYKHYKYTTENQPKMKTEIKKQHRVKLKIILHDRFFVFIS